MKGTRNRFSIFALVVVSACGLSGCTSTSTSTSVTAPSTDKCQVGISSSASSFAATGGTGAITVSTNRDCTWSASTNASWVTIDGSRGGQGDGIVSFSVEANPSPTPRSGTFLVADQHANITQAGAACRFDLSRTADHVGSAGGHLSVGVTTISGCEWHATSSASWLTISTGQSANASGTVALDVAANTGAARVGTANIAGQTYTVSQDAAVSPTPPDPTPPPPTPPPPPPPPPPPQPPPPPPPGTSVQLDGAVSGLSGQCPAVTFQVNGTTVDADLLTRYKHGQCGDLADGTAVRVDGLTLLGGAVQAVSIELKGKDGHNDAANR